MAKNILDSLSKSADDLLKEKAAEISKWQGLKHTKESLELFLQLNIAQINFKSRFGAARQIVCTSNTEFIRRIQPLFLKDNNKQPTLKLSFSNGIHCKDKSIAMVWDVKENKLKSIPLNDWIIMDFISLVSFAALVAKNNNALADKSFDEIVTKLKDGFKLFI